MDVEKVEETFTSTQIWKDTRILFVLGRIFGASYLVKAKEGEKRDFLKIFLQIYCGLIGVLQAANIGVIFSYLGNDPFLSAETFIVLTTGAYGLFCFVNWAFALYVQWHTPKLYKMYQDLQKLGYEPSAPAGKLIYGICGLTFAMMIFNGIFDSLSASGEIQFPRDSNFLKVPVINGIVMAWSTVDF